jgi:hypothetical protein
MRITCCKQNGAQLHPRESATLPTAEPLAVIVNNAIRQMNKLTTSLFSELNCN